MAQFDKILCPLDFSENSVAALDLAADLARQTGGSLWLFSVVQSPVPVTPGVPMDSISALEGEARLRLQTLAAQRLGHIPYNVMVAVGDTVPAILEAQRETGANVIVMATHGRTGVSRFFVGSIAEGVIRRSPVPVLSFRPR